MNFSEILELLALVLNLVYVLLLIRQNIWCWINGIVGSGISVYLFVQAGLYSEALLYTFYILFGIYGWLVWAGVFNKGKERSVQQWGWSKHALFAAFALVGTALLAWASQSVEGSKRVWADGLSTSFSFLATYLETQKVLAAWLYWVAINAFSVWLYSSQELYWLALNMAIYVPLSVIGFVSWRKSLRENIT